jgi:hypothetical protein
MKRIEKYFTTPALRNELSEITACGVPQKSLIQAANSESGAQWQFQSSPPES